MGTPRAPAAASVTKGGELLNGFEVLVVDRPNRLLRRGLLKGMER